MGKKVMSRKAADNEYLHKDFHGAMSCALEYLEKNYGEEAVREYLKKFTRSFYAPLIKDLKERGLTAIKEHSEKIYRIEGGDIEIIFKDNELILNVHKCPVVTYLREKDMKIAPLFYETTKTVNETLCEDTLFKTEFINYDYKTGGNIQKFTRRDAL
jgi:hypothetical protein